MRTIKATTVSSRNTLFSDDDYQIGKLLYPDWFSSKAEIVIADGSSYLLEPKGIFSSGATVKNNDDILFSTIGNWKGQIIITDAVNSRDYMLKMQGFFNSACILTDNNGRELIRITQNFNWKQFRTSYEIELVHFDLFHRQDELLMFVSFYCYKSIMATISGTS